MEKRERDGMIPYDAMQSDERRTKKGEQRSTRERKNETEN